jgi:hypothetical protein
MELAPEKLGVSYLRDFSDNSTHTREISSNTIFKYHLRYCLEWKQQF